MAGWMNGDGLYVKFGSDEGDLIKGGHNKLDDGRHLCEFVINAADVQSATNGILGATLASTDGSFGITIPKGARIEEMETMVETAFTSSGTIGTATLLLGMKKASDRSTELDHDGFLTALATGTTLGLATVGTRTYFRVGTGTGVGDDFGTTIAENGVISASNSQHGSHPFSTGSLRVKIFYRFLS